MPELRRENNRWVWRGTFEDRFLPKDAGFTWNGLEKVWYTYDDNKALLLSDYMLDTSKAVDTSIKPASYATDTDFYPPCPDGLEYRPYQRAGIEFLANNKRALLADPPGSGKTIQVSGLLNVLNNNTPTKSKVLIVSPASMTITWGREIEKWSVWGPSIHVFTKKKKGIEFGDFDVNIISYDRLVSMYNGLYTTYTSNRSGNKIFYFNEVEYEPPKFDIVVLDEAHFCKSDTSKRTLIASYLSSKAKRSVYLTGTPMLNRPIELWPLLHTLLPTMFDNRNRYSDYYCNRHLTTIYYTRNGEFCKKNVWVETGARHVDELNRILRENIMIRREKSDILKQLPKKTITTIELPVSCKDLAQERKEWARLCDRYGEEEAVSKMFGASSGVEMSEMAKIRQNIAISKIPHIVELVDNYIEQGEKVIIMAHHRAVVDALYNALSDYNPVKVVGGMDAENKQESVDKFQNDESTMVFIGNMRAAGVGLTLTSACIVLFAELDFTPGVMEQSMDRAHRIGQTKPVNVYYVVLEGSLDSYLLEMLKNKEGISCQLLK